MRLNRFDCLPGFQATSNVFKRVGYFKSLTVFNMVPGIASVRPANLGTRRSAP